MQQLKQRIAILFLILFTLPALAQDKPNVVLVLMDNFGWGELGTYGGGILRGAPTPRIDSLATEGMKLLNFNVEAQCTPSRAAILRNGWKRTTRNLRRRKLRGKRRRRRKRRKLFRFVGMTTPSHRNNDIFGTIQIYSFLLMTKIREGNQWVSLSIFCISKIFLFL